MEGSLPGPGVVLKDRGWEVYVCAPIFMTMASVAFGMRVYGRRVIIGKFGFDDWLMAMAYIGSLLYTTNCLMLVYYGTGKPDSMLTPYLARKNLQWSYSWHLTYNIAVLPLKLSILFFYLRIASCRMHKIVLYFITTLIMLYTIATSIVFIFRCNPISGAWNIKTFPAGCINLRTMLVFWTAFNVFTDIVLYAVPLPVIFQMRNVSLSKKLNLTAVFTMGLMAVVGSIGRIVTFMSFDYSRDIMWQSAPVVNWSLAELSLAIVAACGPGIKPIFSKPVLGSSAAISGNPTGRSGGSQGPVRTPANVEWTGSTLQDAGDIELEGGVGGKAKSKRPSIISVSRMGIKNESQEHIVTVDTESIEGSDRGGAGGATSARDVER